MSKVENKAVLSKSISPIRDNVSKELIVSGNHGLGAWRSLALEVFSLSGFQEHLKLLQSPSQRKSFAPLRKVLTGF
jgi:hypothetical protein